MIASVGTGKSAACVMTDQTRDINFEGCSSPPRLFRAHIAARIHESIGPSGLGPECLEMCLAVLGDIRIDTPMIRFGRWLRRMRNDSARSMSPLGPSCSASDGFKLPCHLPHREQVLIPDSVARVPALRSAFECAWVWTEWLVILCNFYHCRCPKSETDYVAGMGCWQVTRGQVAALTQLSERLAVFCSSSTEEGWSRGRKTLLQALQGLGSAFDEATPGKNFVGGVPLSVDPERIAVPEFAGLCDPACHLEAPFAEQYSRLEDIVKPECEWPDMLPKPCFMCPVEAEGRLRAKLFAAGMVQLVREEDIPRDPRGRLLVAGLFCVEHKESQDRLIVDRRPLNETEHRLKWTTLPHGTLFCRLRVKPSQSVRGGGDDISCFFYRLRCPASKTVRTCFGRRITGAEALRWGGLSHQSYRLGLTVWPMGDLNAVDVAQMTHESILRHAGGLSSHEVLRYGDAFPRGPVYQGVYVDDHVVVGICDSAEVNNPEAIHDCALLDQACRAYEEAGLPVSDAKKFRMQTEFVAWGTQVSSSTGEVGAPVGRRMQMFVLVLLLSARRVNLQILRACLGGLVHPLMHFRPGMCCFSRAYRFAATLRETDWVRLPADIVDEFRAAALLLAVATTDIRAPVDTSVWASDATPSAGGTCEATVSRSLAEALYDHGLHRGECTRMDWSPEYRVLEAWDGPSLPPLLVQCVKSASWRVVHSVDFRSMSHVNLQEARALRLVLRRLAATSTSPKRVVVLIDSRVCLGAFTKGRSSSVLLNSILRTCLGLYLFGRIELSLVWVDTHTNPADDPSRKVGLRRPCVATLQVQELVRSEGIDHRSCPIRSAANSRMCLEVFSGWGALTRALKSRGLPVAEPIEAFPVRGIYRVDQDLLRVDVFQNLLEQIQENRFGYVHFGLPCRPFSVLRNLSGGLRSKTNPFGGSDLDQQGNLLAHRVVTLCRALTEVNAGWSIENPRSSYLRLLPEVQSLASSGRFVKFDQCCYGLRVPGPSGEGDYIKKPTSLLTNVAELGRLEASCSRFHQHHTCMGTIKVDGRWVNVSEFAGHYPVSLVTAWSEAIWAFFGTSALCPTVPEAPEGPQDV